MLVTGRYAMQQSQNKVSLVSRVVHMPLRSVHTQTSTTQLVPSVLIRHAIDA